MIWNAWVSSYQSNSVAVYKEIVGNKSPPVIKAFEFVK